MHRDIARIVSVGAALAALSGIGGYLWGRAEAPPPSSARPAEGQAQPEMTPPAEAVTAAADDPTVTDPQLYQSIFEDEHVRVLRYHDVPGTQTRQHHHPDSLVYALSSFRRRLSFPDGTSRERTFTEGDVMWVPAQTHAGHNVGDTDTDVLLVEPR